MPLIPPLDEAQLAALLASRICHDLISPVGAINNALELYDDDADMQGDALELMRTAAANASARLQFARLAYGASGSVHAEINSADAERVADLMMQHEKAVLVWQNERYLLPKIEVKLLLNLLLVANASLPRGGRIEVKIQPNIDKRTFTIIAQGSIVKLPSKFIGLLNDEDQAQEAVNGASHEQERQKNQEEIDAHTIQFYYSCLLANIAKRKIDCHNELDKIILTF